MSDSRLKLAERPWQRLFILFLLLPCLALLRGSALDGRPDRTPRPPATAEVRLEPLALPSAPGTLRPGALWALSSPEPRFGGLSALAIEGEELIAITDSGAVVRWPRGGGTASFRDLPAGPGRPEWKVHRDSEALVRDPVAGGWWVTFEQFHSAWRYDEGFTRALERRDVPLATRWRNWGLEGAIPRKGGLLLLAENGGGVALPSAARVTVRAPAQIADAARLADGRVVVALRTARPWGLVNRLGWLRGEGSGYAAEPFATLPLGRWDNVEGLAAETLPGGSTRLWFVTDDDFRRRTLLGWVEIAPAAPPARAGG